MSAQIDHVADKLKQLSPQRLAEVEDFIDFVAEREHERALVRAAQAASEPTLAAIWDNDADAVYDRL